MHHQLYVESLRLILNRLKMSNEHTEYSGEIDVPVEAIQVIDPVVESSKFDNPHAPDIVI